MTLVNMSQYSLLALFANAVIGTPVGVDSARKPLSGRQVTGQLPPHNPDRVPRAYCVFFNGAERRPKIGINWWDNKDVDPLDFFETVQSVCNDKSAIESSFNFTILKDQQIEENDKYYYQYILEWVPQMDLSKQPGCIGNVMVEKYGAPRGEKENGGQLDCL